MEESGVRPYIEIWLLSLRFEMGIVLMMCKMCFEVEQSKCACTNGERGRSESIEIWLLWKMAAALGQAQGALSSHGDNLDFSTYMRPSFSKLWFEYIFYSYVKRAFCLSVCLSVNTFEFFMLYKSFVVCYDILWYVMERMIGSIGKLFVVCYDILWYFMKMKLMIGSIGKLVICIDFFLSFWHFLIILTIFDYFFYDRLDR